MEALQVADDNKPDYIMTEALGGRIAVIGVGRSGAGLKSFIGRARSCERMFGRPLCHVFFVASVCDDLFNDQARTKVGKSQLLFSNFVNRFRLNALLALYTVGRDLTKCRLHLVPGVQNGQRYESSKMHDIESATRTIVTEIKTNVSAPVLVAYCPNVPCLQKGEVSFANGEEREAAVFEKVVIDAGIGFVDTTPALKELWEQKKLFARGFVNARGPGSGHLNDAGIEAVFGYIARKMKERYGL